ncbi:unnamed protein product [Rhizophagus irregularis]|nr:unnamed protein product [Rhizophagus irregularis]
MGSVGLLLDPFSLRLHLGLSILCQGFLFIRPSLRSFFYRSISLSRCVGWEGWECVCGLGVWVCVWVGVWVGSVGLVWVGSVDWECGCNEQQARFYLKATNCDLNVAVVNYYDGTNAIEEPKQVTILKVQMYNLLQLIRSGDIFCEINDVSRPPLQSHPSGPPNGVTMERCAYSEALHVQSHDSHICKVSIWGDYI